MPRPTRLDISGITQHVIQRGNNRQPIFVGETEYRLFLNWLAAAARINAVHVHAYVLMTNHIHLLATPLTDGGVGRMMQALARRYVRYFNDAHGRTGTLWEGRYRATPIDADRYFFTCSRYIELNPVRAGIVNRPDDHKWSSFRRNALGAPDDLVTEHALYSSLGPDAGCRSDAYRALFADALSDVQLNALRAATRSGDQRFVAEIESLRRC